MKYRMRAADRWGRTPLHLAAAAGAEAVTCAELLLHAGADAFVEDIKVRLTAVLPCPAMSMDGGSAELIFPAWLQGVRPSITWSLFCWLPESDT